jgi:hypothetical protein
MWRDFDSGCGQADEAATKLNYLVLRDITKKWTNPPITRKLAATQFAIRFGQPKFCANCVLLTNRKAIDPARVESQDILS